MDNLELLSDDELRRRLLQYGFPNLPITQTTRKTLIKKLRNHLTNTSSQLRKTSSLVTRYSSGEDSDSIETSANSGKRRSALTVSGSPGKSVFPEMPPPRNIYRADYSANNKISSTPPLSTYSRSSLNMSGSKKCSAYVSPVIINDSEDDDNGWNVKKKPLRSINNTRTSNRLSSYSTLDQSHNLTNGSSSGENQNAWDDRTSTSDYTKRLLQLREGTIQSKNNGLKSRQSKSTIRKSAPLNDSDIVFRAEPSLDPARIPLKAALKNFINSLDAAYGVKQSFVPMLLVSAVILFFLLIIFMYVTISPKIEDFVAPSTTSFAACTDDQGGSFSCIDETFLEPSLNLLKLLAAELQSRSVAHYCGKDGIGGSPVMCAKDILPFLSDNQLYNDQLSHRLDLIRIIHNVEYLVDRNPKWGIQNSNYNGEQLTMEEVSDLRAHQEECFSLSKPKLPLSCTIHKKLQTFFVIIGTLAIITVIGTVARKIYQFVIFVKEKRKAQVNEMIREICHALVEATMHNKDCNFVVINHLRERIIAPNKQAELSSIWHEAISYLEQNDGRVHFGIESINGEDLKIVRWLEDNKVSNIGGKTVPLHYTIPPDQSRQSSYLYQKDNTPFAKVKNWRGSAFDHSNKVKDPPTNCLKIRQMFEKSETNNSSLQMIIQDTILFKLKDKNCKILDIQLDAKTCCVYVKCATCSDAGTVHEEINGWWLDSRLVTVKFLRQDKYHQRFPSSINTTAVMHPSSSICIAQSESSLNGQDEYFDEEIDEDDFE